MTERLSSLLVFVAVPMCHSFVVGCSSRPAFQTSTSAAEPVDTTSTSTSGGPVGTSGTFAPQGVGSTSSGSFATGSATTGRMCGNGVLDALEECDEGTRNNDSERSTCLTDCKLPYCGDGILAATEECDDGAANDDLLAGACRTNCELPRCGDGVIDEPGADRCDEGEANSDTAPNACRTNCFVSKCGDGVRDVGETCDLGAGNSAALTNGEGCSTDCRSALCGNGQMDVGEECDDGQRNSDTTPGACRTSCQKATCGDEIIDPTETCDDGQGNSDTQPDRCRTDCVEPTCGDDVKDGNEECDGDEDCDSDCKAVGCGDGVVQEGEECDDGDLEGDYGGCAADCRLAPHCGDGKTDADFEECDDGDGNRDNTYGACRTDCSFGERCGDGVVQDDQEACDKGPDCNASCEFGACSNGQLRCGSESMCIDPLTNGQFCGASGDCQGDSDGYVCPSNAQCTSGRCQCSNGGVICDSRCIDPKSDNQFCGALDNCAGDDKNGVPCSNGTQCEDGSCVPQCNSSQKRCGDRCVANNECCEANGEDCSEPEPDPEPDPLADSCTGPGAGNGGSVSGFPPTAPNPINGGTFVGWGVSHGTIDVQPLDGVEAIHTRPPGEGETGYFLAPPSARGNLSNKTGIHFSLRTLRVVNGVTFDAGYEYRGDVVIQGEDGTTAYAQINHPADDAWHEYNVPFRTSDSCWSLTDDAMEDLLSDVAGIAIRTEYTTGTDNTWLTDFSLN